uniref:RNase H type-1 domain-containing protein n=1 Tax=Gouania willdenowi TaxID=441366 RepID=A0A8C5D9N5_GOUWI
MYYSHRLSNTELKYATVEQELLLLWKAYKEMRAMFGDRRVVIETENPLTKEIHKGSVEFAKAYQSRWGKWTLMLQDKQWRFALGENKGKIKEIHEEKPPVEWDGVYSIFTDGSMTDKDEVGKWGFIVYKKEKQVWQQTGREGSTAQEAEVLALVNALQYAKNKKIKKLKIISDSWYVVDGIKNNLRFWKARDYQNYRGKELGHKMHWIIIAQLLQKTQIWIEHVKSHTGQSDFDHEGNQKVDDLVQARKSRKQFQQGFRSL